MRLSPEPTSYNSVMPLDTKTSQGNTSLKKQADYVLKFLPLDQSKGLLPARFEHQNLCLHITDAQKFLN